MSFQDCLIDAIDRILDWNMPDDVFADDTFGEIVRSQACLMSRTDVD